MVPLLRAALAFSPLSAGASRQIRWSKPVGWAKFCLKKLWLISKPHSPYMVPSRPRRGSKNSCTSSEVPGRLNRSVSV